MNWKKLVATVTVLLVAVAAIWIYMVKSYESELGTSNVVVVEASGMQPDNNSDNQLLRLSFADDAEDLLWSSLEVSLIIDGESNSCSFGSQSNSNLSDDKVLPKLGADGLTFTTIIDSTDDDEYTYFDLSEQEEVDEDKHWMRFSSTDVYLNDGISWAFIEGGDFGDVFEIPDVEMNENNNDRLEWYTYDMSVHRVEPNDGTYVLENNDSWYKVKFLTYYNADDESRYPTLQIAALNGTDFPALSNPDIVVPTPCKIVTEDTEMKYWSADESIFLMENDFDLCNKSCVIEIEVKFETIAVEIEPSEIEI